MTDLHLHSSDDMRIVLPGGGSCRGGRRRGGQARAYAYACGRDLFFVLGGLGEQEPGCRIPVHTYPSTRPTKVEMPVRRRRQRQCFYLTRLYVLSRARVRPPSHGKDTSGWNECLAHRTVDSGGGIPPFTEGRSMVLQVVFAVVAVRMRVAFLGTRSSIN